MVVGGPTTLNDNVTVASGSDIGSGDITNTTKKVVETLNDHETRIDTNATNIDTKLDKDFSGFVDNPSTTVADTDLIAIRDIAGDNKKMTIGTLKAIVETADTDKGAFPTPADLTTAYPEPIANSADRTG